MPKRMLWANRLILSILLAKISKEENNMKNVKNATVILSDEFKKKTVAQKLSTAQKSRLIKNKLIELEESGKIQFIKTRQDLAKAIGVNSPSANASSRIANLISRNLVSERLVGFSNQHKAEYEYHVNTVNCRRELYSTPKVGTGSSSPKGLRIVRFRKLLELDKAGDLEAHMTRRQLLEKLGYAHEETSLNNGRSALSAWMKQGFLRATPVISDSKVVKYKFDINAQKIEKVVNKSHLVEQPVERSAQEQTTTCSKMEQAQEQITVEQPIERAAQHETTEQVEPEHAELEQTEQFIVNIKNNNIEMSVTTTNLAVLEKMFQMMMEK